MRVVVLNLGCMLDSLGKLCKMLFRTRLRESGSFGLG